MKKTIILAITAAALLCSCAKNVSPGLNDASRRYFDAWLQKNHPDLVSQKKYPGFYILNDVPGNGELVGPNVLTPFIRAHCRVTDLDGKIISSTYEQDAYKMRRHSDVAYYGPGIFTRLDNTLIAGLDYALEDMRVGGSREVLIPGWLSTNDRYDTEQEYMDKVSGSDAIYKIEITEAFTDIDKWEQDSVSRFVIKNYPKSSMDTVGFYKQTLRNPTGTFDKDTTIYINYIGRRLDGKVFDTNIADTAKFYGIWNSSGSYSPTQINWKKTFADITMTSSESSVISGFSLLLSKMGAYEKAIGIFTSAYGYYYNGSGENIPAFSPLMFEVEIVDNE